MPVPAAGACKTHRVPAQIGSFGTHKCVPYRACTRVGAFPELQMRHGPGIAAAPTRCGALVGVFPDLWVQRRSLNCGYRMPGAFRRQKKNLPFRTGSVLALPIFPASRPASIVGEGVLNFCVRDGNRWTHTPINTNFFQIHPENRTP